jgi:hypothetical protein
MDLKRLKVYLTDLPLCVSQFNHDKSSLNDSLLTSLKVFIFGMKFIRFQPIGKHGEAKEYGGINSTLKARKWNEKTWTHAIAS